MASKSKKAIISAFFKAIFNCGLIWFALKMRTDEKKIWPAQFEGYPQKIAQALSKLSILGDLFLQTSHHYETST
jgi:hypothetical protein